MKITVTTSKPMLKHIREAALKAAVVTMEAVHTDLVGSQTMPFDTGDMQDNQTFVDKTENGAVLITGAPQARRLYYHPEYNFQRGKNKNAGALWLEPYISGEKSDFIKKTFVEKVKEELNK